MLCVFCRCRIQTMFLLYIFDMYMTSYHRPHHRVWKRTNLIDTQEFPPPPPHFKKNILLLLLLLIDKRMSQHVCALWSSGLKWKKKYHANQSADGNICKCSIFSCQLVSLGWFPFKKQLLIHSVITFVLCLILPLATQSVITYDHLHTQSLHLFFCSAISGTN